MEWMDGVDKWSGWIEWMDTPYTVISIRAPEVPTNHKAKEP